MDNEPISNCCPKCQSPLPVDAPQGLCPRCLLAAVATPTEAGQPSGRPAPPPLEEVAAAFPQLEILEFIGQGGMGFVFKARQPKLDRLVALKILPQSLAADPTFAERFNREARLLARLSHPGIVTVHDFGVATGRAGSPLPAARKEGNERRARSDAPYLRQTPGARPKTQFYYLLMEFVDGVNLRQAMQAGRFTPDQALAIVPKICEALQFAHNEGILHRDIKPENILLDAKGRVKIADFGIAKLVGDVGQAFLPAGAGDFPVARSGIGEEAAQDTGLESPANRQAGKPALRSDALTEAGKALGTLSLQIHDPAATVPDAFFDRQWALTILDRALAALAAEHQAADKTSQFETLKPWLTGDTEKLSQAEAARRLDLNEGALKVAIHRLRKRFRELVKAEIAQTVGTGADLQAELIYLLEVLSQPG